MSGEGKEVEHSGTIRIAPSLMCADLCHFAESMRRLEECGADLFHIDIMDAHFVPNMPMGLEILRQARSKTSLAFDAHLMVENNDFFVEELAAIGVQQISAHVESAVHLDRTLGLIREHGILAGVALNPTTPLSALDYALERTDFVVLMMVNPGFAGQRLVPSGIRKIAECKAYLDGHGLDVPIEVDGNVSLENIPRMVAAGAQILVAGTSSVFREDGSLQQNFQRTREAIARGLKLNDTR